jgi:hypothetical protein
MGTDIYRSAAQRPHDDMTEEERELLALGEKTGLFANAGQRRRVIVRQLVVIAVGVAIMAHWGLDPWSLNMILLAVFTIGIAVADPALRRQAVRRAVREAPAIEPPLR